MALHYIQQKKELKKARISLRISFLKSELIRTDYKAIKYAEGLLSEEEYNSTKELRTLWRDEINSLQTELETLEQ